MRLLFDQNLSPRLIARLADLFPGSAHVSDVGLDRATDSVVWEFARIQGLAIVTKDADFGELGVVRGFPPKVVWIRVGNCTTQRLEQLLRENKDAIAYLSEDATAGVLVVT